MIGTFQYFLLYACPRPGTTAENAMANAGDFPFFTLMVSFFVSADWLNPVLLKAKRAKKKDMRIKNECTVLNIKYAGDPFEVIL